MRNFLTLLWQRKFLFLAVMLLGLLSVRVVSAGFVLPSFSFLFYESRAVIAVEPDPLVEGSSALSLESIYSLKQILVSRAMARLVVDELGLVRDPEFGPKNLDALSDTIALETTVLAVKAHLKAGVAAGKGPDSGARAIEITFEARDPQKAALIANTAADIFVRQHAEYQANASVRLASELDDYLAQLRRNLREAEQNLAAYQKKLEATQEAEPQEDLASKAAELQSSFILAQAKLAQAETRYKMMEDLGGVRMSLDDLLEFGGEKPKALKERENVLVQEKEALSERYGPKHPDMIAVDEGLEALRAEAAQTIKSMETEAKNAISRARKNLDTLKAELQAVEAAAGEQAVAEEPVQDIVQLRELERQVQAQQMLFDYFLKNYRLDLELAKIRSPDLRVLYYASVPSVPVYPRQAVLAFAALGAFALAWLLVGLLPKLFKRRRHVDLTV